MQKFKWNPQSVPRYLKKNKATSGQESIPELEEMRKRIRRQAGLALLTVVLTVVILFAMTSAWYTNIVQTNGLIFKAESWGFDGTIKVSEESILASPGDKGLVELEVKNTSDSISAISVNVNKTGMADEMQKRLFFYVDTQMNRDGETMDRVYLNSYEGYTYTVFNKGDLILTEQASNAPQLKWQWVYDVLGYYVLGQPQTIQTTDAETGETVTVEKMSIKEYLRPIEYDLDEATTKFVTNEDGELNIALSTVDGSNSMETFLKNLSSTDGYDGIINTAQIRAGGYYPVDVDDTTGYGIYAYLCNYSEIQMATTFDSNLGKLAYRLKKGEDLTDEDEEKLKYIATLSISAQKSENSTVSVSTLSALETAMAAGTADVVQLSADITIPAGEVMTIPKNSRVMVDLNNHTITSNSTGIAIQAEPGSSVTMINGSIVGPGLNDQNTYAIYTTGSEVVMSDIKMNNFRYGIYIGDNKNNNSLDSRVHMVGCEVDAEWYGIATIGNGTASQQKTQLIVEKSVVRGGGYAIFGNGSTAGDGQWGTDIQIINSTIEGYAGSSGVMGTAIYQPQKDSTLSITDNSTVSGYVGVAIKGGSVRIVDSTIKGLGQKMDPTSMGSGFTDTGDAVYIETNYGYEILLEIDGNSILESTYSKSLQVYKADDPNVYVKIYSGSFKETQPDSYIAEGSIQEDTTVRKITG